MATRMSKIYFILAISAVSTMAAVCIYYQQHLEVHEGHYFNSPDKTRNPSKPEPGREFYGKIELPGKVFIDLVPAEKTGAPVTMIVSAFSKILAGAGTLTLRIPSIGNEPARTQILWSGTASGPVAETVEYVGEPLPEGKYKFVAVLEFTVDQEKAKKLSFSRSLYLDVRPATILSSNVSFEHIKRVELLTKLEKRVLVSLKPGLAHADSKILARERALIEANDPGIIARKIEELKATDPEVARRIMELNQVQVKTVAASKIARNVREGPPAPEKSVPVPEAFREQ